MKKVIIAVLAVSLLLSPLTAMAGNTTLYGKMRYSFASVQDDTVDGLVAADNTSLLGVKGSYGDDMKAFFHLQTGAKADDNSGTALAQRFFFAGLKSSLGKVQYGRMTNAYKMPGFKLDRFYNTAGVNATGVSSYGGATYGLSGATNGFTDNALEFTSPKIADLITAHGGLYVDDANTDDHGYSYGAKIATGSIMAGVVGATNGNDVATVPGVAADQSAVRGYGKYQGKGYSLGVSYENVEDTATTDVNYLYVIGSYNVSDKLEAIASYGNVDSGAAEGDGFTGGLFYSIAPNTQVFALVSAVSLDDSSSHAEDNPTVYGIGFFHNFSMSSN
jgi:hypothetical protein